MLFQKLMLPVLAATLAFAPSAAIANPDAGPSACAPGTAVSGAYCVPISQGAAQTTPNAPHPAADPWAVLPCHRGDHIMIC